MSDKNSNVVMMPIDPMLVNLNKRLEQVIESPEFDELTYEAIIGVLENTKFKLQVRQFGIVYD